MYPVLFNLYDIDVLSLSVLLVLAFIVFNLVLYRLISVKELNILFWNKYLFLLSFATIIGARLAYVATFLDKVSFAQPFFDNLNKNLYLLFNPDGFSFYGGIFVFVLIFLWISQRRKEPFWQWMDLFTVSFFIWLTIASVGFFLGGIYYGAPTNLPWGVLIDNIFVSVKYITPIHPVQLYTAGLSFLIFMILYIVYRKKLLPDGFLTFVGAVALAISDFAMNFFRGDDTLFFNILRFDQWLDIAVIIMSLIGWQILKSRQPTVPPPR